MRCSVNGGAGGLVPMMAAGKAGAKARSQPHEAAKTRRGRHRQKQADEPCMFFNCAACRERVPTKSAFAEMPGCKSHFGYAFQRDGLPARRIRKKRRQAQGYVTFTWKPWPVMKLCVSGRFVEVDEWKYP